MHPPSSGCGKCGSGRIQHFVSRTEPEKHWPSFMCLDCETAEFSSSVWRPCSFKEYEERRIECLMRPQPADAELVATVLDQDMPAYLDKQRSEN